MGIVFVKHWQRIFQLLIGDADRGNAHTKKAKVKRWKQTYFRTNQVSSHDLKEELSHLSQVLEGWPYKPPHWFDIRSWIRLV